MTNKDININNFDDNFLDLLSPNLDDAQKSALRTQENAVIAAGAGSGKTQVLASRFSWLIMTGQTTVDRILTLTFTKKAAAEMYQRIYKTLTFFAKHEPDPKLTEENIKLAKEAVKNFSSAHIQTLDSYCGSILRQCANRYGIKPDFSTDSTDAGRNIKNKAFQFALINKDNPGIVRFSEPGKLQDFAENVFAKTIQLHTSLGTEENYFTKKLSIQCEEIAEAWNYYALGYITNSKFSFDKDNSEKNIKHYISVVQDTLNVSDKKDDKKKQAYINCVNELIEMGFSLSSTPKITTEDIINNTENLKDSITSYNKFIEKMLFTTKTTGGIKEVKGTVSNIKKEFMPFVETILNYIEDYNEILEINRLLDKFLEEINNEKRISGSLSFNDVSSLSLKILLENKDIRNQEKSSYDKIMIDEFQDNNGKNRDLLYLISLKENEFNDENNSIIKVDDKNPLISQIVIRDEQGNITEDKRSHCKLFFVGDEKQSIYKFRGAEVSVFNELTKGNENKLIPMTYNYRSSAQMIQAFNTFFENGNCIFDKPLSENDKKDYEAYYEEKAKKNGDTLPTLNINNIPIHMNILNGSTFSKEDPDLIPMKDQVAYFIAKKISEISNNDETKWNDIAILTKSRTDYSIITKYLSMLNIQYEVDQFNNIFEDGIINDFYNFFRICVYPSDINAYGAYLASPFCGLSVNSVEIILSHLINYSKVNNTEFNPFVDSSIDTIINSDLSTEDYTKYINGKTYFENIRSIVLQQPITNTLSELWHKKGYKYESLLSKATLLCAEHFDMLFELGRQADSNGKSISWFVDQLDILKKNYFNSEADIDAKNISYPLERKHAVQIMTIHKSKGLQFKNVFVYGCFGIEDNGNREPVYFDEYYGVTLKPETGKKNYFNIKGKQLSLLKEAAELRRVIYVAITRAIDSVNIIGSWTPERNSNSIFHFLENAMLTFYPDYNKTEDDKPIFNPDAGFDYSEIIPITYNDLPDKYNQSSIDELREKAITRLSEMYNKTKIVTHISTPTFERKTPSSLEKENTREDSDTGLKYEQPEDTLTKANFTPGDFGTLVHSYLEAQANNIPPEIYEPKISLFKNLSNEEIAKNKKLCIDMCHKFKNSSLGQDFEKAKENNDFYRAEWGFRMMVNKTIFTGSIDLIFSNGDGTYTIVDYKSDNTINPDIYIKQQYCYRTAASKLLKTDESKISLYLFYLKHDKIEKL